MVWVRWLAIYAIVTALVSRAISYPEMRISHGVLLYLLLIVGASRAGGRALAATMVTLSYLAVDYFFVPPRHAIGRPSEFDLVILVGFVVTSAVIAQLVISLQNSALVATERAAEIERLSAERLVLERDASRAQVLQEAERLKDALLASLSHDLRSPIMALTMLADPASGISAALAMPRIAEQAKQLNQFLSTVGRFTSSGSVDGLLLLETHPAADLIGAALQASAAVLVDRSVAVPAPDAPALLLRCDFTLSLQILGNLLQNAARYSPPGATIEITAVQHAARVAITVSDCGQGVAAHEWDRIFQPLRRGDAAGSTPGTGMGLAIARTFARAQRGDVRYRPRDGGGSHFDLLLPSSEPAA
jgi:K+-sensing histidine kinase KdpD